MIRWRPIVVVLILVAAWDTVGLAFGGDRFFASHSYDVLRGVAESFSFAGQAPGIRIYAVGLTALVVPLTYALLAQRRHNGRISKLLRITLSGLAGYWTAWCFGIGLAFIENGAIYAWGSLGKLLGISAITVLAARVPPPPPEPAGGDTCGD